MAAIQRAEEGADRMMHRRAFLGRAVIVGTAALFGLRTDRAAANPSRSALTEIDRRVAPTTRRLSQMASTRIII